MAKNSLITHVKMYRVARVVLEQREGFKVLSFEPDKGARGIVGYFTSVPPWEFIAKRESCELTIKIMQDAGKADFEHAFVETAYYGPNLEGPNLACPHCGDYVWLPEIIKAWQCLSCHQGMMIVEGVQI